MSDTFGFPEAARQLGVPVRVLRKAIRAGRIPSPGKVTATATLSAEWLDGAKTAAEVPGALTRTLRQPVPAFARFEGTSFWTKFRVRARAYRAHRAASR